MGHPQGVKFKTKEPARHRRYAGNEFYSADSNVKIWAN